jgi:hypothetical protein
MFRRNNEIETGWPAGEHPTKKNAIDNEPETPSFWEIIIIILDDSNSMCNTMCFCILKVISM